MADRANGGTSIAEMTSAAATRPAASSRRARSVRAIGRTAASSRRRASSSEIVEENGRITLGRSSRGLLDEMSQLGNQQPLQREPHRGLGPWQRDDDVARNDAGAGAA